MLHVDLHKTLSVNFFSTFRHQNGVVKKR